MLRIQEKSSLRCGNQVIDLTSPLVMGIVNATPDSFYAPSRSGNEVDKAVDMALSMASEGAKIIDIGGMSSRPGADTITEVEELRRVIPVIEAIHATLPELIISIDTYRSTVAHQACKAGATMINDISGGEADEKIYQVSAECQAAYILMHMRGSPKTMQLNTQYQYLTGDLIKYFIKHIHSLHKAGVYDIVLDPGFGFAKTEHQNYMLINQLDVFSLLRHPLMIGISRKSTLSKTIGRPTEETIYATTALHMTALQNGASILRVHDVRPALDTIAVYNRMAGIHN